MGMRLAYEVAAMGTRGSLVRARRLAEAGFTAIELMVVVAVIGIIMAASAPFLLSYVRTSTLRAGAEEMSTVLGRARQMAIRDNTSMCVERSGTGVQYRIAGCAGLVWTGAGTNAAGLIQLANNITVTNGTTVNFSYIGTAAPSGTFTVSSPDGQSLSVIVAPSGRVSLGP
jgi:prepilin-type N-terminal cleavage/methylation domain-containing protein